MYENAEAFWKSLTLPKINLLKKTIKMIKLPNSKFAQWVVGANVLRDEITD
jgi:hypothetical protein